MCTVLCMLQGFLADETLPLLLASICRNSMRLPCAMPVADADG